ncbi:MAG: thiol:disulfide oxidoreductase [Bradyrhizobium sp.]|nr:thiol:disulfide oxidoreductase [Bradyrhizobium sp.]
MIELFYAPTPNGWKVSIMLEEIGLPYVIRPIFISNGDQHASEFLKISPNNKIPAIIDHDSPSGGAISVFETGAILLYLAEKSGKLMPISLAERYAVVEWLMWQVSGLGPMLGQHGHFFLYASEKNSYAIDRYRNETKRLYGVLDRQLAKTGAFVAGDEYSVADIACFPWIMTHKKQAISLDEYPSVKRWFAEIRSREAVQRGIEASRSLFTSGVDHLSDEARAKLFGIGGGSETGNDVKGEEK